jgi:hypothetical protein
MTKKSILGCLRVPPVEYHWVIWLKYAMILVKSVCVVESWKSEATVQCLIKVLKQSRYTPWRRLGGEEV